MTYSPLPFITKVFGTYSLEYDCHIIIHGAKSHTSKFETQDVGQTLRAKTTFITDLT
jgi:hypothetical protein